MDKNTGFGKLFQMLIEQHRLSPDIAQMLLQRILQILSEAADKSDCTQSTAESEVTDK